MYLKRKSEKIASSSFLKFYEHTDSADTLEQDKVQGNLRNTSVGYNFWEENSPVKRTKAEEKLILAFENTNSFGELFINNQKQISSQQGLKNNSVYIQELDSLTKLYNKQNIIEKIYLQTNKDIYLPDETISYFGYHINGSSHQPIIKQNVIYVDLVSLEDKKVISQKVKKTVNGTFSGTLTFSEPLKDGNYKLIAYSNWMRNFHADFFFSKTIRIGNPNGISNLKEKNPSTHMAFFPEGGYLISNITSRIGFKSTNKFREYKKVKGKIVDSKNNLITSFGSKFQGCGYFYLKPKLNETYFAVLENGKKYKLPKIKKEGYSFNVNNLNDNTINVRITATKKFIDKDLYLFAHMYRDRFYQKKIKFERTSYTDIQIPKANLPTGVLVFSILNDKKQLMGERAIFINNLKQLNIDSKITIDEITKNSEINIETKTKNADSNVFVTVLPESDQSKKDITKNINTYLKLESEIKGNLYNTSLLFKDNDRSTKSKLDMLMLSHDFRKYNWNILNSTIFKIKEFEKEDNLTIRGVAKNKLNQLLRNSIIRVIAKSNNKINIYESNTNIKGEFKIKDFNHNGETELVFEAIDNNIKTNQVRVRLIPKQQKNTTSNYEIFDYDNSIGRDKFKDVVSIKNNFGVIDLNKNNIKLDEVIVNGRKRKKKKRTKSLYNISVSKSHTLEGDVLSNANSIMDVIDRVPGVRIRGDALDPKIYLNNNGVQPLFILDGLQLNGGETITSDIFASQIATMDLSAIERIEVLQGNETSIFGARGFAGVIIMYSKRGRNANLRLPKPLSNFLVYGFDSVSESSNLLSSNLFSDYHYQEINMDDSKKADDLILYIEGLSTKGQSGHQIKKIHRN